MTEELTFEQVTKVFEARDAADAHAAEVKKNPLLKVAGSELDTNYDGSFTLKPANYHRKEIQRVNVKVPRVKLMALLINQAYPVNRSYI